MTTLRSKPKHGEVTSTEVAALKKTHRLVRDEQYDASHGNDWGVRLARRYYDQLFKEFAIVDLGQHRKLETDERSGLKAEIGVRWRTEREVVSGKGDITCAEKRCSTDTDLSSFELPFMYHEDGVQKVEMVKARLCRACTTLLNKYGRSHRACVNEGNEAGRIRSAREIDSAGNQQHSDQGVKKKKITPA